MDDTKYKTIDIMLNLQTVGLCDNAVITQLTAVAFSLDTGINLDSFNEHIGIRNSVQKGLRIDSSSIEWWFNQPQNVYEDVFLPALVSEVRLEDVLGKFSEWIETLKTNYGSDFQTTVNVWGNYNKWIRQAYKVCKIEPPWEFYEDRDVRTLVEVGHRLKVNKNTSEESISNALDDCRNQIKNCSDIYNKLIQASPSMSSSTGSSSASEHFSGS